MSEALVGSANGRLALEVCGVKVSYGAREALRGVTLHVSPGQMVGVIGPNGSGKSTLLKAVTHVVRPVCGKVFVAGHSTNGLSRREMARAVSVVEQSTDVGFDFTVREVVGMGRLPRQRYLAGESVDDRNAIDEAMEVTRVCELQDRSIRALSGGERQRVLLARALAQDTPLLLLDEPTSHLDIGNQVEVMDLVRGLCRDRGRTVVAVLHDLNLASQYCDWLVLMKGGEVYSVGSPSDVVTEDHIWNVYAVRTEVAQSPSTGRPYVVTVAEQYRHSPSNYEPHLFGVHVICGGGSGELTLRSLKGLGYRVTAGVLNLLDSDEETCRTSSIPAVVEAPFSPISEERLAECCKLAGSCDAVVVCPVPFAAGNVRNLEVAAKVLGAGKTVIVIDHALKEWDFVGGQAVQMVEELFARGAVRAGSVSEALAALQTLVSGRVKES